MGKLLDKIKSSPAPKVQRRIAGGASGVRQDDDFYPTPFNLSYEFILQGLRLADKCLALFLPIRYLTGKSRAEIYKENPPTKIIVIPNKVDFLGNAVSVCWPEWIGKKLLGDDDAE